MHPGAPARKDVPHLGTQVAVGMPVASNRVEPEQRFGHAALTTDAAMQHIECMQAAHVKNVDA